jgi:hypothetical protein
VPIPTPGFPRHAPRLAVWITGVSFTVIAGVLGITFLLLSWQTQSRLMRAVADDLEGSQQRFADIEARRTRERRLQAVALAENPTLKAAVDTYVTEVGQAASPGAARNHPGTRRTSWPT